MQISVQLSFHKNSNLKKEKEKENIKEKSTSTYFRHLVIIKIWDPI